MLLYLGFICFTISVITLLIKIYAKIKGPGNFDIFMNKIDLIFMMILNFLFLAVFSSPLFLEYQGITNSYGFRKVFISDNSQVNRFNLVAVQYGNRKFTSVNTLISGNLKIHIEKSFVGPDGRNFSYEINMIPFICVTSEHHEHILEKSKTEQEFQNFSKGLIAEISEKLDSKPVTDFIVINHDRMRHVEIQHEIFFALKKWFDRKHGGNLSLENSILSLFKLSIRPENSVLNLD